MEQLLVKLQKEIFELTGGYIATWLPDFSPLIGDYGVLARGRLLADGNLGDLGYVNIDYYTGVSSMENFKYSHDITIHAEAKLDASAQQLGGGFTVAFNSEGSFLYHFQNAKIHRIDNKGVFFKELAFKIMTGEIPWDDSYVIVDEVVVAERSTILISKSRGGSVRIMSEKPSTGAVNFADPALNLAFSTSKGTIFDYAGHSETRPLYHAVKPTIKPRGSVKGSRGPKPTGPSLGRLYEHAKKLVGGRELTPIEIDLRAETDDMVEASLNIDGRTARFLISFENVTPEYVIEDNLGPEEVIIPVQKFLVFEE